MALFNKAKTLTTVALAATAFTALPVAASANDYRCESKNDQAQVIGGVLGAVLGGVVGSEIAGRGDGNEGAFIGAAIGAAAGAGLGDESVTCQREQSNSYVQTANYNTNTGYQPAVVTVAHRGNSNHNYRPQNQGYNNYNNIDRQIAQLRAERDQLQQRNRYDRSPWIDRRIAEVGRELDRLKDIKRNGTYTYRNTNNRGHVYNRR